MKRMPQVQKNSSICRRHDRQALSRQALYLFCGVMLSGCFIWSAKQHFTALAYGYRFEELRHEKDDLLREQHQLTAMLDESLQPARLERSARQIGMEQTAAAQLEASFRANSEEKGNEGLQSSKKSERAREPIYRR